MNETEPQLERFKVMITVMNTDILGFNIESSSTKKNWILIAFLFMIGLSIILNNLIPVITNFNEIYNNSSSI